MQNPLLMYRRTQRELRRQFDEFTRQNCETCPTPCCRKPARILPTDILLAEAAGWKPPIAEGGTESSSADLLAAAAGQMASALHNPPESGEGEPDGEPCDFLGSNGCTFPHDLRPFGCTTFICRYMHERMDRPTLSRVKRLTRELQEQHRTLMRSLRPWPGDSNPAQ